MGRLVVRPAGYTGFLQQLTWAQGTNIPVTAHLWGGGGGGGGNDSNPGGNGGGGGYTRAQFNINEGDVLEVAVGGPGGGGTGGRSAGGGGPGLSFLDEGVLVFSTLETALPPVFRQFNSAYCTFLNTYGVWVNPTSAATFDRTYTINFPVTGWYQFTASADNAADIYLAQTVDGTFTNQLAITSLSYTETFSNGFYLTAGTKQVRIVGTNYHGPGAVAFTIATSPSNFGGSYGGSSGGYGSSGAGGGGGGATVVLLNGTAIGAAGGGGGGGGGGNSGTAVGQNAPGDRGQAPIGTNEGQNGTIRYVGYDGGGGGGGGGGWGGGNGGLVRDGDQGGFAGAFGGSSGANQNPSGRFPGGMENEYYRNGIAMGGQATISGGVGYAVFEFDVPGTLVNTSAGGWEAATDTWIKVNGTWIKATTPYIKKDGVWYPVNGYAPVFENVPGRFGASPRVGVSDLPPAVQAYYPDYGGDSGGWSPSTPDTGSCTAGSTTGNDSCSASADSGGGGDGGGGGGGDGGGGGGGDGGGGGGAGE